MLADASVRVQSEKQDPLGDVLFQGFEVTHGVGGLAKTPLAGCSPTSDAGSRPQGSSWEGKKDKKSGEQEQAGTAAGAGALGDRRKSCL